MADYDRVPGDLVVARSRADEKAPTLAEARRLKTEKGLGLASRPVNDEASEAQPLRAFVR